MVKSKFRGHKIECHGNDRWFFCESGASVEETWMEIECGNCGNKPTQEGHDSCLGVLKGVKNACCGHGNREEAYIQFNNGEIVICRNFYNFR